MPVTSANGVEIYFEESGSPDDPALLLVNGFTAQLTSWDPELIDALVDAGFRVICFDNRDVGLTSRTAAPLPAFVFSDGGFPELDGPPPYTLGDMADDGLAVLDALGVGKAHVVGVSMGGMIVQQMALRHPDRILSMTSIMSSTGDRNVGEATPEATVALMTPPPADRDGYIDYTINLLRAVSGPHADETRTRERAACAFDRAFNPIGAAYQLAAILDDGDRTERLAAVTCPTLVIHGRLDPLINPSGGEATAKAIPHAELVVIEDMGHDLSVPLIPQIVGAIAAIATRC